MRDGIWADNAGVVGGFGPCGVSGDFEHDLRNRARARGGTPPETRSTPVRSPREVSQQTLPQAGTRQVRQERLQEVCQRRTPWPLLVPLPPEAERKRPHERIRRQGPAPAPSRRVRYTKRATSVDLAQDFLCTSTRHGSVRLHIIR